MLGLAVSVRLAALGVHRPGRSEEAEAAVCYRLDLVSALVEEKGFKRIPPAERCALYERGDAGLLLYQHPTEPSFSFSLGCEDPAEMERLARAFEARTGLKGVVK